MYQKVRNHVVDHYRHILERILAKLPLLKTNPNRVTYFSLLMGILSGLLFMEGYFFWGGIVLLIGGIGDTLDGQLARLTGKVTLHGAFLDSSLDRYSDFAVFAGFIVFYRQDWLLIFILLGTIGSQMVSYTRARGESLGCKTVVGLMQRPERVILISVAAILQSVLFRYSVLSSDIIIRATLILMAILTNTTALRRMIVSINELKESSGHI